MTREHNRERGSTRRRFLKAAAATAVAGGVANTAVAQDGATPTELYAFEGRVQAWTGVAPEAISGQENPTLNLQVGNVYQVSWRNADGQPHNFALQDADGNNLPVIFADSVSTRQEGLTATPEQGNGGGGDGGNTSQGGGGQVTTPSNAVEVTDTVSEQGTIQTLEFVATDTIAQYICTIHPTTMVGDVNVQGSGGGNAGDSGGGGGDDGGGGNGGGANYDAAPR